MSVQSEISRIKANIQSAYASVAEKGGALPDVQDSANLPACIDGISFTTVFVGSGTPADSLGSDGDIYLDIGG